MKTPEFHLLARAVVVFENRLLLAHCKSASNTFLPGGHVEVGESMPDTVIRELEEEFGLRADVGRYLGAIEHRWHEGDREHYEVNHLFEVSLPDVTTIDDIESKEAHLEFIWADPSELSDRNLQPYPLASILAKPLDSGSGAIWASTLATEKPNKSEMPTP